MDNILLHDFLTYFDLDEQIGDFEVTTVNGLIVTELGYTKTRAKIDLE